MVNTAALPETCHCAALRPELVADARLVLADLDGCLMSEGSAFPDSMPFVEASADRLWIISNNSTHTAFALSVELNRAGLAVDPSRVLLAGEQTLKHVQQTGPGQSVTLFRERSFEGKGRGPGCRVGQPRA